jgi:UDP-N-acetylmuramate dehydrogenase
MKTDESMASHCSWRAGGPARRLYRPADSADLVAFLKQLPDEEPLLWVGLGSNLLVRDGGFPGTVVLTTGRLAELTFSDGELRVEAGASCAKVARECARAGMVGLEFFAGIPGTVGGALAMNAGAFGGETWEHVLSVETVDRHGEVRVRAPGEFSVRYREVKGGPGEWFLAARLRLQPGDSETAQQRIRTLLERRAATQPTREPSCGSTFRNPPSDHAARLIEAAGLKGLCIGQACVSEKHANFIVNRGGASAADIEALIGTVRERVEQDSGIRLQTEVHIVGDAA